MTHAAQEMAPAHGAKEKWPRKVNGLALAGFWLGFCIRKSWVVLENREGKNYFAITEKGAAHFASMGLPLDSPVLEVEE